MQTKQKRAKRQGDRREVKCGISQELYDSMVQSQGGKCAIRGCFRVPENRAWDVDHDHMTGRVRMLLCNPCNQGLGLFRDDPSLLEAAAEYLRKFPHSIEDIRAHLDTIFNELNQITRELAELSGKSVDEYNYIGGLICKMIQHLEEAFGMTWQGPFPRPFSDP